MGVPAALAVLAVWGAVCSENCARAVELTPAIQGQVQFEPSQSEGRLPERFRMTSHAFSYAFQPLPDFARYIRVGDLTFPSAITSESERNNTVHCEYYQP